MKRSVPWLLVLVPLGAQLWSGCQGPLPSQGSTPTPVSSTGASQPGPPSIDLLVPHSTMDWIEALSFSRNNELLAVSARDGTIALIRVQDKAVLARYPAVCGSIPGLTWSHDHRRLAAACTDGSLAQWDVGSGAIVERLQESTDAVTAVAYSADGKRVAFGLGDGTVRVRNLETKSIERSFTDHITAVEEVGWSSDDRYLASAAGDGKFLVYSMPEGKVSMRSQEEGNAPVTCLSWKPGAHVVATCTSNPSVWDVDKGKKVSTLTGASDWLAGIGWTAGGNTLIGAGYGPALLRWEMGDATPAATKIKAADSSLGTFAMSPNGKLAAFAGREKGALRLWTTDPLKQVAVFPAHNHKVGQVSWNPQGSSLAWTTLGDLALMLELEPLRLREIAHGPETEDHVPTALSFSAEGKQLLLGSWGHYGATDRTALIVDVQSGKVLHSLSEHGNRVDAVRWGSTPERVWTSSWDKGLRLWNWNKEEVLRKLPTQGRGIEMSRDGAWIATTSEDDKGVVLDGRTGDTKINLPINPLAMAFTGDSSVLAATVRDKSEAKLYDLATGKEVRSLALPCAPSQLAWSPVARHLAVACGAQGARIWREAQDRWEQVSKQPTRSVAWHPSGRVLAVGGDGLRLVRLEDGARVELDWLEVDGKREAVAYSESNQFAASAAMGRALVFRASPGLAHASLRIEEVRPRYDRAKLIEDLLSGRSLSSPGTSAAALNVTEATPPPGAQSSAATPLPVPSTSPKQIYCFSAQCDLTKEVCCADSEHRNGRCAPNTDRKACRPAEQLRTCDEQADCPTGQVCCEESECSGPGCGTYRRCGSPPCMDGGEVCLPGGTCRAGLVCNASGWCVQPPKPRACGALTCSGTRAACCWNASAKQASCAATCDNASAPAVEIGCASQADCAGNPCAAEGFADVRPFACTTLNSIAVHPARVLCKSVAECPQYTTAGPSKPKRCVGRPDLPPWVKECEY